VIHENEISRFPPSPVVVDHFSKKPPDSLWRIFFF
jgi:hypothetical protein